MVRGAMAVLSPPQREAIELAYFGGLTQYEIAERTGHAARDGQEPDAARAAGDAPGAHSRRPATTTALRLRARPHERPRAPHRPDLRRRPRDGGLVRAGRPARRRGRGRPRPPRDLRRRARRDRRARVRPAGPGCVRAGRRAAGRAEGPDPGGRGRRTTGDGGRDGVADAAARRPPRPPTDIARARAVPDRATSAPSARPTKAGPSPLGLGPADRRGPRDRRAHGLEPAPPGPAERLAAVRARRRGRAGRGAAAGLTRGDPVARRRHRVAASRP